MTSCPYDFELEALVVPDSATADLGSLRQHVAACAACAAELEMLRRERQLFAVRIEATLPAPRLARDVVLGESPRVVPIDRRAARLPWAHVLVAACAACALLVARLPRPLEAAPPTTITAAIGATEDGALASTMNASFVAEEPRVCVGFDLGVASSSATSSVGDDGRRFCGEIVTSSMLRP